MPWDAQSSTYTGKQRNPNASGRWIAAGINIAGMQAIISSWCIKFDAPRYSSALRAQEDTYRGSRTIDNLRAMRRLTAATFADVKSRKDYATSKTEPNANNEVEVGYAYTDTNPRFNVRLDESPSFSKLTDQGWTGLSWVSTNHVGGRTCIGAHYGTSMSDTKIAVGEFPREVEKAWLEYTKISQAKFVSEFSQGAMHFEVPPILPAWEQDQEPKTGILDFSTNLIYLGWHGCGCIWFELDRTSPQDLFFTGPFSGCFFRMFEHNDDPTIIRVMHCNVGACGPSNAQQKARGSFLPVITSELYGPGAGGNGWIRYLQDCPTSGLPGVPEDPWCDDVYTKEAVVDNIWLPLLHWNNIGGFGQFRQAGAMRKPDYEKKYTDNPHNPEEDSYSAPTVVWGYRDPQFRWKFFRNSVEGPEAPNRYPMNQFLHPEGENAEQQTLRVVTAQIYP